MIVHPAMQMLMFEKGGVVVQWLIILFPHHVFLNKSEAATFSSCSQRRQSSETIRGCIGGKSRQVNTKGSGSVMAVFNYVLILVCFYCFFFLSLVDSKLRAL